jgi:phage anti-repressor protein
MRTTVQRAPRVREAAARVVGKSIAAGNRDEPGQRSRWQRIEERSRRAA